MVWHCPTMTNLVGLGAASVAVIAGAAGVGLALKPTVVAVHTVTAPARGFFPIAENAEGTVVRVSCPRGEAALSGSYRAEEYYITPGRERDVTPGGVRTVQSYPETTRTWLFRLDGNEMGVEGVHNRATFY